MKKVTIYGASDDCIEIDGCKGADEFYANAGDVAGCFDFVSQSTMGRMRVYAIYDGCWHFSFGQGEEGDTDPQWLITTTWEEYTAKHIMEVPDDTICSRVK